MIVTVCVSSERLSSTPLITKVTEDASAGMVTVAGTMASVVSLLARATLSGAPRSVFQRVTEAVVLPPFSLISAGPIEIDNRGSEGMFAKARSA